MAIDTSAQPLFKRLSLIAGVLAITIGAAVMLGWAFDIVTLKSLWLGLATMKANTAFCFALAGAALCLATSTGAGNWRWNLVRLFALMILLIGALSLAEDVFVFNAGIDQLLFRDLASARAPGRMAPATALNWIAVGAALVLIAAEKKRWRLLVQWPALLVALAALVAIAGYIYSAQQLYTFRPYATVALHTAVGFLIVALGLLCVPPHGSLVMLLCSRRLGGTAARLLLPVVIGLPLIGGWVRLEAQRAGWVGTDLGTGLFATGLVVMLVSIVWATARAIESIDASRERAVTSLRTSEARIRNIFEQASDGIFLLTAENRYLDANPAGAAMFGYSTEELLRLGVADVLAPHEQQRLNTEPVEMMAGKPHLAEWEHLRKDGSTFTAEVSAQRLNDQTYLAIVRDLTSRKQAEAKLIASTEQLRALSARVQAAREEEGTRIAREIHDELGGVLTGLKWDLEDCERVLSASTNGEPLATIRKKIPVMTGLLDTTIDTVRRISSELRPGVLDDLGLVAAIEWQGGQFYKRTGIDCKFREGLESIDLSREQATAIFRVFQEVLTNVIRHAEATRVEVKMSEANSQFVLEVRDNGRGISESERQNTRSLGLLGMQERVQLIGGDIEISGSKGKGTVVVVRVPLK